MSPSRFSKSNGSPEGKSTAIQRVFPQKGIFLDAGCKELTFRTVRRTSAGGSTLRPRADLQEGRATAARRTVLFIAYHFPPIRSTGIERTRGFLRHLPEFGYKGRVLTTSAFGEAEEESRFAGCEVLRAWEPLGWYRWLFNPQVRAGRALSSTRTDPGSLTAFLSLLRRRAMVPDGQVFWIPAALWRAVRSLRDRPVDLIYSTYPPASAHLLALLLKRIVRIPWVADFRDAWTCDPLDPALEELPYRKALEKRLEETVVDSADAVIASTELCASDLRELCPFSASKVQVVPNGFEPDDFPRIGPPPSGETMRIVHTGSFAYSHPLRTPGPLFAALESLVDEDPDWKKRVRLVLAGALTPEEEKAGARLAKEGVVEMAGPRKRDEALELQRNAHLLLLVDHPRARPASNVPAKFYEYLAAHRPILALCGPGMVERMLRGLQAGYQAPADDPQAIRNRLVELYDRFRRNRLGEGVEEEALRPFRRRELARKLAACFDRLLEEEGGIEGDR